MKKIYGESKCSLFVFNSHVKYVAVVLPHPPEPLLEDQKK